MSGPLAAPSSNSRLSDILEFVGGMLVKLQSSKPAPDTRATLMELHRDSIFSNTPPTRDTPDIITETEQIAFRLQSALSAPFSPANYRSVAVQFLCLETSLGTLRGKLPRAEADVVDGRWAHPVDLG